jgi:hypothetical protein
MFSAMARSKMSVAVRGVSAKDNPTESTFAATVIGKQPYISGKTRRNEQFSASVMYIDCTKEG